MIDIHSHILPNMDDGPKSVEEALLMAEDLAGIGFKTVFATPHIYPGVFNNSRENILDGLSLFRKQIKEKKIEIDLRAGAEVFITPNLIHEVDCGLIMTMDDRKKFILIDLPFFDYPDYIDHALFSLLCRGITPIISHPERNVMMQENIDLARGLAGKGIKIQVTIASLAGLYGEKACNAAESLLKKGLVHYLATDLHKRDGSLIKEGMGRLETLIGQDGVKRLLEENVREVAG